MTKPRKTRNDSTDNLHRIFAAADTELAPPAHVPLSDAAWPFFHSIVDEYAKADWTPHQLELAAMLARTMAQLEFEERLQRAEGQVIERENGTTVQNPRNRVVASLLGQVLAMRRSLSLTGRAKAGGRTEEAARKRDANRRAEQSLRGNGRNDLLA